MQLVQPLLTTSHVEMVRQALALVLNESEKLGIEWDEGEEQQYRALGEFFQVVAERPSGFPPAGKMAIEARKLKRGLRGPAQPLPKQKRKRTQLRKQAFQKRTRAEKRRLAEEYNEAVARVEQDMAEAREAAEEQQREQEAKLTAYLETLAASESSGTVIELFALLGFNGLVDKTIELRRSANAGAGEVADDE